MAGTRSGLGLEQLRAAHEVEEGEKAAAQEVAARLFAAMATGDDAVHGLWVEAGEAWMAAGLPLPVGQGRGIPPAGAALAALAPAGADAVARDFGPYRYRFLAITAEDVEDARERAAVDRDRRALARFTRWATILCQIVDERALIDPEMAASRSAASRPST